MSIIIASSRASSAPSSESPESTIEPDIRELLDHIAVELAEEYVRLMEAAAKAETAEEH